MTNSKLAAKLQAPGTTTTHDHAQFFTIHTPNRDFAVFATDGKFEAAYKMDTGRDFIAEYKTQKALRQAIAAELG